MHPQGDAMLNNYGYNYDFDKQYLSLDKGYTVFNAIVNARVKLPFGITYSFNASPRYQQFRDRYHESSQHPDWKTTNGLDQPRANPTFRLVAQQYHQLGEDLC